jgi:hypothetical protein
MNPGQASAQALPGAQMPGSAPPPPPGAPPCAPLGQAFAKSAASRFTPY